jgi:hypothetical protein
VRQILAIAAVALALAGATAPALGHQDPSTVGFISRVTGIRPQVPGLSARIVFGDDQLEVTAPPGRTIMFTGYEGEPYIKFDPTGVYWNDRSPARYLNSDRFARLDPPPRASAKARPVWVRVAAGHTYSWHDHRIHWMSPVPPPAVRDAPDEPHHVLDWRIPARVVGGPGFAVLGRLDYDPAAVAGKGTESAFPAGLVAGLLGAAAVIGGGAFLLSRRRRRPSEPESPPR